MRADFQATVPAGNAIVRAVSLLFTVVVLDPSMAAFVIAVWSMTPSPLRSVVVVKLPLAAVVELLLSTGVIAEKAPGELIRLTLKSRVVVVAEPSALDVLVTVRLRSALCSTRRRSIQPVKVGPTRELEDPLCYNCATVHHLKRHEVHRHADNDHPP